MCQSSCTSHKHSVPKATSPVNLSACTIIGCLSEWVYICHLQWNFQLPAGSPFCVRFMIKPVHPPPFFDGFSISLLVYKSSCFSLHSACRSFGSKSFSLIVHRALLISQHSLLKKIGSSLPCKKYIVIFLQRFHS